MRNIVTALSILLSASSTSHAQQLSYVFQGEIEGVRPIVLHVSVDENSALGLFESPIGGEIKQLEGTLDWQGNLTLYRRASRYPVIKGNVKGRLIEGKIIMEERADPKVMYGYHFLGIYRNSIKTDYFGLYLAHNGYRLRCLTNSQGEATISTGLDENGKITLRCDSLQTYINLHGDTLTVDPSHGVPAFMHPDRVYETSDYVFTPIEDPASLYSMEDHYMDNPDYEVSEERVNDTLSIRLCRILPDIYYIAKSGAAVPPSYEVVTDPDEIKILLGDKVKQEIEYNTESEEWLFKSVTFTYNDGTRWSMDWCYSIEEGYIEEVYRAYYPQLDILVMEEEAGGDWIVDFNSSANKYENIGDPAKSSASPDGKWRVAGYYPGGAADTDEWWLEWHNPSTNKYEVIFDFKTNYRSSEQPAFEMPRYIEGFFWVDDSTVLFKNQFRDGVFYKLELIVNG